MSDDRMDEVRDRLAKPQDIDPGTFPDGDAAAPAPPPPADPDADALSLPERGATFPLNDIGNGRRFELYFGEDVLRVPRVGWFAWDGRRWRKDPDELAVRALGQKVSALIEEEIPHIPISPGDLERLREKVGLRRRLSEIEDLPEPSPDDEIEKAAVRDRLSGIAALEKRRSALRQDYRRHAKATGNSAKIDNMLTEASVAVARLLEDLDSEPLAVNVQNGTLRFVLIDGRAEGASRVAEVRLDPHRRADLQTKLAPAIYDPSAECPRFDDFLERIQPSPEMRAFLMRWFGLSMTAEPVQRLAFFHGDGANGKSVLVDLMARLMGDYAASVRIEALTGRNRRSGGDATPELIPLVGARFVRSSEPEEGERLQEAKIKEITSGEPMQARGLHGDFFDLKSDFKLTVSGNHKPEIRGTDTGIWRRMMLVPFTETIPEGERIPLPQLVASLFEERSGILNKLAAGLCDYLENGLQAPEAVLAATAEYRDDSDPIGQFLADCCDCPGDESKFTRTAELVDAFLFWMEDGGGSPWRKRTVQIGLKKKAGHWRHPRDGATFLEAKRAGIMGYQGIALNPLFEKRLDEAPTDAQGRPIPGRRKREAKDEDPF